MSVRIDTTDLPDSSNVLDDEPLLHRYPSDPAYRLSGAEFPQIGDLARCGHVKRVPHRPPPAYPCCERCVRLDRIAKGGRP